MRITTFFNHETLMNQVTLLRDALRSHLAWHGARLSFVAAFLVALLRVKTVNLSELATALSGKAQTDSHDKRLQRFLGVVHEGVAFPLVWCLLNKRGNSNSAERMKLINQFLECFGDREMLASRQTEGSWAKPGLSICSMNRSPHSAFTFGRITSSVMVVSTFESVFCLPTCRWNKHRFSATSDGYGDIGCTLLLCGYKITRYP
jgi:hypothetical protein